MHGSGISMRSWLRRKATNRFFADFYDEDKAYYVFDHELDGQEVAGPFGNIIDAYKVAYSMNHPPRTVLVHVNIQVPTDITLSPEAIGDAVLAHLKLDPEPVPGVYREVLRSMEVSIALAEDA